MASSNPIEFVVDEEEANGFFEGDCQDSPFEYDGDSESDEEGSSSDEQENIEPQENEDGEEEEYEFGLGAYMFEPRRRAVAEGERPPVGDDRNRLETTDWYVLVYLFHDQLDTLSLISCWR